MRLLLKEMEKFQLRRLIQTQILTTIISGTLTEFIFIVVFLQQVVVLTGAKQFSLELGITLMVVTGIAFMRL